TAMPEIEGGHPAVESQFVVSRRSERIAIHRAGTATVVDGFTPAVRAQERPAMAEALLEAHLQRVVRRVRGVGHHLESSPVKAELRTPVVDVRWRSGRRGVVCEQPLQVYAGRSQVAYFERTVHRDLPFHPDRPLRD